MTISTFIYYNKIGEVTSAIGNRQSTMRTFQFPDITNIIAESGEYRCRQNIEMICYFQDSIKTDVYNKYADVCNGR